jgi:hypothetical protein
MTRARIRQPAPATAAPATAGAAAAAPGPADPGTGFLARRAGAFAALLLGLLAVQGLLFITESSQTSDEGAHLSAGYSYLKTADFRLNPEHPPLIKELAALPLLPFHLDFPWGPLWDQAEEWNIGRLFVHENRLPNDTLLLLGRLPVLALSLLLGWSMFRFGRRLFGAPGALLGLALYVLDPNVVAHSGLVTTDLGITLFIFLAVVAFWRWSENPSPARLALFGLAAGGAFAAKFTALWLPPILAVIGGILLLRADPLPASVMARGLPAPGTPPSFARRLRVLLGAAAVVLAIAFAVVAATYGLVGLPAFVTGLQRTLHHSAMGHRAYLMGNVSETGWWYYFPVAWILKTPPGTILIVAASLAALALGRRARTRDEIFLYVPVVVTVVITCFWKVNIGLRHLLPIYPFLYLGAGRLLMTGRAPRSAGARLLRRAQPLLVTAALGWTALDAAAIAPYDLAYFNVLAGGPANGHRFLLDSNLDWGQSAKALQRYVAAQGLPAIYVAYNGNSDPWYYGVRYQYVPGSGNLRNAKERALRVPDGTPRELIALNVMVLHSLHFSDRGLYDWLLARKPVATPGYSYFVFDITGEAESHSYISVLCLNFGLAELAEFEAHRALRYQPGNALARAVLEKIAAGEVPEGRAGP